MICYVEWYNPRNQHYYYSCLQQDMFGTLVILNSWGGLYRHGGRRNIVCQDEEDAYLKIAQIDKRRLRHGYIRLKTAI